MPVDYNDIYKQKQILDKESCDNLIKDLSKDKRMAKMFSEMSTEYNEKEIEKGWDDVLQDKHEQIFNASITRKPKFVIEREERERRRLFGLIINELPKPINDDIFIELNEIKHTLGGVEISSSFEPDNGIIYKTAKTNNDFNINDRVLFNNKKEKTRFRCNEKTYVVISEKDILAIYG